MRADPEGNGASGSASDVRGPVRRAGMVWRMELRRRPSGQCFRRDEPGRRGLRCQGDRIAMKRIAPVMIRAARCRRPALHGRVVRIMQPLRRRDLRVARPVQAAMRQGMCRSAEPGHHDQERDQNRRGDLTKWLHQQIVAGSAGQSNQDSRVRRSQLCQQRFVSTGRRTSAGGGRWPAAGKEAGGLSGCQPPAPLASRARATGVSAIRCDTNPPRSAARTGSTLFCPDTTTTRLLGRRMSSSPAAISRS